MGNSLVIHVNGLSDTTCFSHPSCVVSTVPVPAGFSDTSGGKLSKNEPTSFDSAALQTPDGAGLLAGFVSDNSLVTGSELTSMEHSADVSFSVSTSTSRIASGTASGATSVAASDTISETASATVS